MENNTETPLPLIIPSWYDDPSNPENTFCVSLLNGLYQNTISPSAAAAKLDTWVTESSEKTLQDIRSNPSSLIFDDDGVIARKSTPNASGYIDTFFQAFPWLCEVFAPHSEGQKRIVDFLDELLKLEVHEVPDGLPDPADLQSVRRIRIWERAGYVQPDRFTMYEMKDRPDDDHDQRSRNRQSTLCRISMIGFVDCSYLSLLPELLPAGKKRSVPTHIIRCGVRPADIETWLDSAAQWLRTKEEATWVYARCREQDKTTKANPRDVWSRENWELWKVQFKFYAEDDRVTPKGKEYAGKALRMMEEVEK